MTLLHSQGRQNNTRLLALTIYVGWCVSSQAAMLSALPVYHLLSPLITTHLVGWGDVHAYPDLLDVFF